MQMPDNPNERLLNILNIIMNMRSDKRKFIVDVERTQILNKDTAHPSIVARHIAQKFVQRLQHYYDKPTSNYILPIQYLPEQFGENLFSIIQKKDNKYEIDISKLDDLLKLQKVTKTGMQMDSISIPFLYFDRQKKQFIYNQNAQYGLDEVAQSNIFNREFYDIKGRIVGFYYKEVSGDKYIYQDLAQFKENLEKGAIVNTFDYVAPVMEIDLKHRQTEQQHTVRVVLGDEESISRFMYSLMDQMGSLQGAEELRYKDIVNLQTDLSKIMSGESNIEMQKKIIWQPTEMTADKEGYKTFETLKRDIGEILKRSDVKQVFIEQELSGKTKSVLISNIAQELAKNPSEIAQELGKPGKYLLLAQEGTDTSKLEQEIATEMQRIIESQKWTEEYRKMGYTGTDWLIKNIIRPRIRTVSKDQVQEATEFLQRMYGAAKMVGINEEATVQLSQNIIDYFTRNADDVLNMLNAMPQEIRTNILSLQLGSAFTTQAQLERGYDILKELKGAFAGGNYGPYDELLEAIKFNLSKMKDSDLTFKEYMEVMSDTVHHYNRLLDMVRNAEHISGAQRDLKEINLNDEFFVKFVGSLSDADKSLIEVIRTQDLWKMLNNVFPANVEYLFTYTNSNDLAEQLKSTIRQNAYKQLGFSEELISTNAVPKEIMQFVDQILGISNEQLVDDSIIKKYASRLVEVAQEVLNTDTFKAGKGDILSPLELIKAIYQLLEQQKRGYNQLDVMNLFYGLGDKRASLQSLIFSRSYRKEPEYVSQQVTSFLSQLFRLQYKIAPGEFNEQLIQMIEQMTPRHIRQRFLGNVIQTQTQIYRSQRIVREQEQGGQAISYPQLKFLRFVSGSEQLEYISFDELTRQAEQATNQIPQQEYMQKLYSAKSVWQGRAPKTRSRFSTAMRVNGYVNWQSEEQLVLASADEIKAAYADLMKGLTENERLMFGIYNKILDTRHFSMIEEISGYRDTNLYKFVDKRVSWANIKEYQPYENTGKVHALLADIKQTISQLETQRVLHARREISQDDFDAIVNRLYDLRNQLQDLLTEVPEEQRKIIATQLINSLSNKTFDQSQLEGGVTVQFRLTSPIIQRYIKEQVQKTPKALFVDMQTANFVRNYIKQLMPNDIRFNIVKDVISEKLQTFFGYNEYIKELPDDIDKLIRNSVDDMFDLLLEYNMFALAGSDQLKRELYPTLLSKYATLHKQMASLVGTKKATSFMKALVGGENAHDIIFRPLRDLEDIVAKFITLQKTDNETRGQILIGIHKYIKNNGFFGNFRSKAHLTDDDIKQFFRNAVQLYNDIVDALSGGQYFKNIDEFIKATMYRSIGNNQFQQVDDQFENFVLSIVNKLYKNWGFQQTDETINIETLRKILIGNWDDLTDIQKQQYRQIKLVVANVLMDTFGLKYMPDMLSEEGRKEFADYIVSSQLGRGNLANVSSYYDPQKVKMAQKWNRGRGKVIKKSDKYSSILGRNESQQVRQWYTMLQNKIYRNITGEDSKVLTIKDIIRNVMYAKPIVLQDAGLELKMYTQRPTRKQIRQQKQYKKPIPKPKYFLQIRPKQSNLYKDVEYAGVYQIQEFDQQFKANLSKRTANTLLNVFEWTSPQDIQVKQDISNILNIMQKVASRKVDEASYQREVIVNMLVEDNNALKNIENLGYLSDYLKTVQYLKDQKISDDIQIVTRILDDIIQIQKSDQFDIDTKKNYISNYLSRVMDITLRDFVSMNDNTLSQLYDASSTVKLAFQNVFKNVEDMLNPGIAILTGIQGEITEQSIFNAVFQYFDKGSKNRVLRTLALLSIGGGAHTQGLFKLPFLSQMSGIIQKNAQARKAEFLEALGLNLKDIFTQRFNIASDQAIKTGARQLLTSMDESIGLLTEGFENLISYGIDTIKEQKSIFNSLGEIDFIRSETLNAFDKMFEGLNLDDQKLNNLLQNVLLQNVQQTGDKEKLLEWHSSLLFLANRSEDNVLDVQERLKQITDDQVQNFGQLINQATAILGKEKVDEILKLMAESQEGFATGLVQLELINRMVGGTPIYKFGSEFDALQRVARKNIVILSDLDDSINKVQGIIIEQIHQGRSINDALNEAAKIFERKDIIFEHDEAFENIVNKVQQTNERVLYFMNGLQVLEYATKDEAGNIVTGVKVVAGNEVIETTREKADEIILQLTDLNQRLANNQQIDVEYLNEIEQKIQQLRNELGIVPESIQEGYKRAISTVTGYIPAPAGQSASTQPGAGASTVINTNVRQQSDVLPSGSAEESTEQQLNWIESLKEVGRDLLDFVKQHPKITGASAGIIQQLAVIGTYQRQKYRRDIEDMQKVIQYNQYKELPPVISSQPYYMGMQNMYRQHLYNTFVARSY